MDFIAPVLFILVAGAAVVFVLTRRGKLKNLDAGFFKSNGDGE